MNDDHIHIEIFSDGLFVKQDGESRAFAG